MVGTLLLYQRHRAMFLVRRGLSDRARFRASRHRCATQRRTAIMTAIIRAYAALFALAKNSARLINGDERI